jgi:SAM-dependent methyltransferase
MTDRACIACDKNSPHVFRFKVNGCEIWQCEQCGLGRAETSTFDPKSYYTVDYFSGSRADGYSDYLGAEPVLRREFARSIDFVRRFVPSGRLLDVGCAYGFFLKQARCHFDIFGIELAEQAAASCREAGLNVLSGVANESNMERIGEVDVITMFDVIEHLPQPREVLALCYRYLKPGGIIVITTGRFCIYGGALGGREVAIDDATAASLVLHPGKPVENLEAIRIVDGAFRSSSQTRSVVAHSFSVAADASCPQVAD